MKDYELNELLKEFRDKPVSNERVAKWQLALGKEKRTIQISKRSRFIPMVAASVVGFVLGATLFGQGPLHNPETNHSNNSSEDATIEYVLTKTD